MSCLLDWNIDRKLSTLTVDNCTTNDAMIHMICDKLPCSSLMLGGNLFHMRCCAHILNLIVRAGLSAIETGIEAIRDSVAFWTATLKRVEKFEEATRQLKVPCTKKLALDCVTRWNITYIMLTTALIYKDVFARLKQRESAYKTLPFDHDWMLATKMCDKQKLFYSVIEMFSGTKYPTSNMYFPKVCEIRLLLDGCLLSNVEEINVMAANMVGKFDKFWMVIHGLLAITTVLDPRFKLKLIEYYFPKIYGNDSEKQIDRIRKMCYDLVNEYQMKYSDRQDTIPMDLQVPSMEDVHEHDTMDPLVAYDLFVSSTSNVDGVKSELDYYLEESVLPRAARFDILAWWRTNGIKYPILQCVAKDILAIPISTVASESTFSTGGRHLSPHRNRLNPKTLEALICAQDWLWTTMEGSTSSPLYSIKEETIKVDEDPSFVKYDA
ncbi:hypothetical protein Dsin_009289 [Dipteronia sinensis]|uniref:Transposase n=1 Tax=Dipteronia sinensis TaxID=43782 RepID=A0AAE0EBS8_9ROSI|nr:hypothetical protein Dsin_009289 [Dipteronia sinensis]